MKKRKLETLLMGILVLILLFAIVKLGGIIVEYKEGWDTYKELAQYASVEEEEETMPSGNRPVKEEPEYPDISRETTESAEKDRTVYYGKSPKVNFEGLKTQNADTIAWIYAPGTAINYPIVQGKDNDYYLNHMFNGAENDCGSIFMEALNMSDLTNTNTFIYGHHMKDGSMFASLLKYREQDYYDTHPVMWIETPEKSYKLEIFTGFQTTTGTSVWQIEFATEQEHQEWLDTVQKYSSFTSSVVPTTEDRIVTLSTCSSGYDEGRFVVMGILREQ